MTFRRTDPNTHYRTLRLQSTAGRWDLGLSPYLHGTRLRMGFAGLPPRFLDLCLGHNARLPLAALLGVLRTLESLEEDCTPNEVEAAFPKVGKRLDPKPV